MASLGDQADGQGHQDEQNQTQNKELNELLNPEERRELVSLVKRTMDRMGKIIHCHTIVSSKWGYDGTHQSPPGDENENEKEDFDPGRYERAPPLPPRPGLKRSSTNAEVKAEAHVARHFGSWRESVMMRFGEVIKGASVPTRHGRKGPGSRPQLPGMMTPTSGHHEDDTSEDALDGTFVPVPTTLKQLPVEAKLNIINSLLLLLLSLKYYGAYSRTLLVHISSSLGLSTKDLAEQEIKVAKGLIISVKEMSGEEEKKAKAEKNKTSRRWKVGLASVAGAALIGVTGGLAAPLVAAGLGAVMGTLGLGAVAGYLGAVAGSSVIVGGIFGAYGARMSGRVMQRYTQEVEDFAFIPVRSAQIPSTEDEKASPSPDHRLRVTIGISGWLTSEEDIVYPWRVLGDDAEVFALRFELRALLKLGNALTTLVKNTAWMIAGREIINRTILAPIVGALALPLALQKVSRLVDNPFRVALNRADKAGAILADALINKAQGERPVTLIGYSLGARVIFSCLNSLAKRRAYGLIENAILIGAPAPSATGRWRMMRNVVSGRLINVFSENDSILRFLYRTNSMQLGIAGLEAITNIRGVENYDLSAEVSGHLRYQYMIGEILQAIGVENLNEEELWDQADKLHANDEEEEQRMKEREEIMKLENPEQLTADDQEMSSDFDKEVSRLERKIEQRTEDELMHARMGRIQMEDTEN